jgi:hypothetical protein
MHLTIIKTTFSLVLGSIPFALAQTNCNLPNGMFLLTPAEHRPPSAAESRCVVPCDFTNLFVPLLSLAVPGIDPDSTSSYSMLPGQQGGETELKAPDFTSRVRLADLPRATSPQGWRFGDSGALSYTSWNLRAHLVFSYTPDLGALLKDFEHLNSFSLIWQYSLGNHKPASWADVPTPNLSEHARPAPTP